MDNRIVVIAGPTASGKTKLGIELANALKGEIVSADSMQVYRGMDIGTAKADEAERAAAPHHMLDVADPRENYSVARYVEEAGAVCDRLLKDGRTPVLVGGTGLYIDSLLAGRDFAENREDMALRRELEQEYDRLGGEEMLRRLGEFDPARAARLHPGDRRRIVRAIEIYRLTGVTATAHDEETRRRPPRYDAARIVLGYRDRADLLRAYYGTLCEYRISNQNQRYDLRFDVRVFSRNDADDVVGAFREDSARHAGCFDARNFVRLDLRRVGSRSARDGIHC